MSRTPKRDTPGTARALNNNVVITVDASGRERVVMGPGIGFRFKNDGTVDMRLVEKSFVLESRSDADRARTVLQALPYEVVDAVMKSVEVAERQLGRDLGARLPLAILDHMQFVVERLDSGQRIPTAPMPELGILYPEEYVTARSMVTSISESLEVELPPEERVFLTMHLLNTTRDLDGSSAALQLRRLQHIVSAVETGLGITLEVDTPDFARFVLHVQFLLQRLSSDSMLRGADTAFHEFARHSYPRASAIATTVREYIATATGTELTDEEMLYITVHVERLSQRVTGATTT